MKNIKCIAILHKAWSWVGFGLDCQWSGLSCPYLSLFPSAFPLLQAPGQRRRQIPHLASQLWPRQAWHSSRIAVGPPSATSCSPYVGYPRAMGTIPHPLVLIAPILQGFKRFPRQKGLKASPWLLSRAMGMAGGPSHCCAECSNRKPLTVAWPSPEHAQPRSLSHCLSNHKESPSLKRVYPHKPIMWTNWERGMPPRCVWLWIPII